MDKMSHETNVMLTAARKSAPMKKSALKSVKRMAHAGILRGWDSWREQWEEGVRTRQMLKQAGGRLLRPKLAASMALWRYSWEQGSAAMAAQSYEAQWW